MLRGFSFSELLFHLSIFPTSLTDSFRRRGTGGKMILASWKLFSDSKMTNAFQNLQAITLTSREVQIFSIQVPRRTLGLNDSHLFGIGCGDWMW
ncbi:MAG: hypothetical protein DMF11_04715 [Verrucomicrobia bacterium]|nr:MAG: hypothetical protein DMF11_04715 [Verrucomicrobiota bacterium]